MSNLFRFKADLPAVDIKGHSFTYPIYGDSGELVGGFAVSFLGRLEGDLVHGFVAGVHHPAALSISLGEKVYFTPIFEKEGNREWLSAGKLTELSLNNLSVEVVAQEVKNEE